MISSLEHLYQLIHVSNFFNCIYFFTHNNYHQHSLFILIIRKERINNVNVNLYCYYNNHVLLHHFAQTDVVNFDLNWLKCGIFFYYTSTNVNPLIINCTTLLLLFS